VELWENGSASTALKSELRMKSHTKRIRHERKISLRVNKKRDALPHPPQKKI